MDTQLIKEYFVSLEVEAQDYLLGELEQIRGDANLDLLTIREAQLNNKGGSCPHCGHLKYTKDGHEKSGVQRYRCKSCKRSFNAYSGTWLAMINEKQKLVPYLKLMREGLSLDKITNKLVINKKTAFDWRHKILASLDTIEEGAFDGITESDETFFFALAEGLKRNST